MPMDQRHREPSCRVFAAFGARPSHEMCSLTACPLSRSSALWIQIATRFSGERSNMTGAIPALSHRLRPLLAAICLGAASVVISAPVLSVPALARGPEGIADVAEKVIDAVVNI